jgi:dipeptidyl aminopeptidase/acylaminoacyl peptidase
LVSHEAFNVPPEFWIAPVGSGSPREITHFNEPTFAGRDLPAASVIHYASYDGTVISALLAMPVNLRRDGSNPMILLAHGGPNEQVTDSFNRVALGLASRGYIVIAPNVRGSSGFGKAFQHANFKDLGGGDLSDELYAVKWLLRTGYVDPKRIGITGTSYGGFMVLMAIGKAPGIWAAAAEGYGVIDWRAMLEDSDPLLQQFVRGLLGDPVNDGAIYRASSPLSYLRSATAPLLVWQGENDIRVPKQQTEAVVAGMRSAGKIVEAHYYSDEGHGLEKRENQVDALRRTIDWFDRYLKHAPGGALQ